MFHGGEFQKKTKSDIGTPIQTTDIFSVTGNILAVSGDDNHVSLWRESPDRSWNCISDEQAAQ